MADRLGESKNVLTHSLEKNTTTRKKKNTKQSTNYRLKILKASKNDYDESM